MKPEKLSRKALLLMANMHGMNRPVTSADLAFLAPQPSGAREWALSALKRLQMIGFMENGPRIDNAQSFALTAAGREALHAQLPAEDVIPETVLSEHDGPTLFSVEILGARRLILVQDSHSDTLMVSTPTAEILDDVIESRSEVAEGMCCEPCFYLEHVDGPTYALSEKIGSAENFRTFCEETAHIDPQPEDLQAEAI